MPRVSVVIPNWNGEQHLRVCLESLAAQVFKDFEVILVDDASTDDFRRVVADFPWVKLIELGTNQGFAAAANTGIREGTSPFVILLNNDTRAEPDFVERLLEAMQRHPEAGLGAAKMVRFDPPNTIDSAGDALDIPRGHPYTMGTGEPAQEYSDPAWVLSACGGAAIYRRDMLEKIGAFDEDFYFSSEDVDLSLRALVSGHRCLYVPDAVVYHRRGLSLHKPSAYFRAIAMRNHIWLIGKNLPWLAIVEAGAFGVARTVRRNAWRLKQRLSGRGSDLAKGDLRLFAREFLKALRLLPRKRREVQRLRRVESSVINEAVRRPRRPLSEPDL